MSQTVDTIDQFIDAPRPGGRGARRAPADLARSGETLGSGEVEPWSRRAPSIWPLPLEGGPVGERQFFVAEMVNS